MSLALRIGRAIARTALRATIPLAGIAFGAGSAAAQAGAPVTYHDVAPILRDKCVRCHAPNEMAPMALTSYKDVRPWARSIRQKVSSREMPP